MRENLLIHTYLVQSGAPHNCVWCIQVLLEPSESAAFSSFLLDQVVEEFGDGASIVTDKIKKKPEFVTANQVTEQLLSGKKISEVCQGLAVLTIALDVSVASNVYQADGVIPLA